MAAARIFTTNEVAEQLGTDPKALRKFFRSDKCTIEPVGQGRRYVITTADVKAITKAYEAYRQGKIVRAATPAPAAKKSTAKKATPTRNRKTTKPAATPQYLEKDLEEDLNLDLDEADSMELEESNN